MTLVRANNASFGYDGNVVVGSVDLAVEPGDFIGLLGPNGSGKTTLFRGLLGLLEPMGGTVERAEVPVGYVPQTDVLDPVYPLTAEEVVRMGAYGRLSGLRRLSREERALAIECLERVRLADRRRRLFASLSGGQRQRVLIARALMTRPRLLLLDEPTSGVDRGAATRILRMLAELNADGMAVLLVSHDLRAVREAVREVVWIQDAHIERGTPEELLSPNRLERLLAGGATALGDETWS